ncbi:probable nuclear transport factor; nuclear transp ort factor (ntf) [Trichuris trichiura]|uniref:NTF2-related export protein n=2 Tax=Trichuris TaxID=36086 RepID=A0A077YWY7_TRITR
MAYNPNFESIGQAFVQHYYRMFDVTDGTTRSTGVADLYDPLESYVTFEGAQMKGKEAILQKYSGLPFKSIQRAITKVDCQPLADGSVLVLVLGQLKTDEDMPQSYSHTFVLKPAPGGTSFFISNEIFTLVLHNM